MFFSTEKSHMRSPGENNVFRPALPKREVKSGLDVLKAPMFQKLSAERFAGIGESPVASG